MLKRQKPYRTGWSKESNTRRLEISWQPDPTTGLNSVWPSISAVQNLRPCSRARLMNYHTLSHSDDLQAEQ